MVVPENSYILIMPDGKIIPAEDMEYAKALVNTYYEKKLELAKAKPEFEELDFTDDESREEVFRIIGNDEGEPMLYETDSIIEAVRESDLFDDEKEEIITSLLSEDVEIDEYSLDAILLDVQNIELLSY